MQYVPSSEVYAEGSMLVSPFLLSEVYADGSMLVSLFLQIWYMSLCGMSPESGRLLSAQLISENFRQNRSS